MTKSRIFLFLLLAFIAGVAARSFLEFPIIFIWIGALASMVAAILGILRKQKTVIVYGFLVVVFLVGIFRFDQVEQAQPDLSAFYGKPLVLRGIIWEEPERTQSLQRLKIKVTAIDDRAVDLPFYTLITTRRYPEYVLGGELRVQGLLEEPENFAAPAGGEPRPLGRGDFDYVSYLSRQDVYSVVSFPIVEKIGEGKGSKVKLWLSRAKHAFEENIDRALPEPHAAFLKGLTLGERESLPQGLVENFNRTGTTHIVALSGYNITMLGRFFIAGLLSLTIPFRISFWIATTAIVLFVILTGASPSVVRAGIMGILVLVAQREGRLYRMTNALVFAGAAMIFHNPKILRFDAAFELSFLATVGLIYLSPKVERFFEKFRSKPDFGQEKSKNKYKLFPVKQVFSETLSAQLMVLPLLIYLFGRVSLVSPLSNILILLAVPYSMALGFLTGLLGFLWEAGAKIVASLNWVLLEYQIGVIDLLAGVPAASIKLAGWMAIPLALFYGVIFWKWFSKENRR